jgi:hypothetical protein
MDDTQNLLPRLKSPLAQTPPMQVRAAADVRPSGLRRVRWGTALEAVSRNLLAFDHLNLQRRGCAASLV